MSYQRFPQDYPPPGYGTQYPPPTAPAPPGYPTPEGYPPPQGYEGYPPPPGYEGYPHHPPPPGYGGYPHNHQHRPGGYQGYFNDGYPPPPPPPQPYPPTQVYHCEHYNQRDDGCFSFLKGCLAALCCCCVLEECCF